MGMNRVKNKALLALGLTVIVVGTSIFLISKNKKNVEVVNVEPVEIVTEENNEVELYMEYAKKIDGQLKDENEYIFKSETFNMHETFGESSKTNVTVAASFEAKYGLDCSQSQFIYNEEKDIFEYIIKESALGLSSVTNTTPIKEIGRNETMWDKMKDSLPLVDSGNEERKETAINRLIEKSKESSIKDVEELKIFAEPQILNHINSFLNLTGNEKEIKIIWAT